MMRKLLAYLMIVLVCLTVVGPAGAENIAERRILLSGNAEDTFIAQQDCYAEGEEVVVFFQKGMTVRGDMLILVEEVMADLSQYSGLTFAQNYPSEDCSAMFDEYYAPGVFRHVNADREKINVLVADLTGYSPWAAGNMAVVDIPDMDRGSSPTLYHELAHVLYMRNAVDAGALLNEGLATYTVDRIYRDKGIADWTVMFYLDSPEFDPSCISRGAEGFDHDFPQSDDNYCYGYRFVTFLCETYGEDIIARLLAAATADHFHPFVSENEQADHLADTEHMKKIIRSVTHEDVFDLFAQWHEEAQPRLVDEFQAFAEKHGQE